MGCICCSDILVYDADTKAKKLTLVAQIRGSYSTEHLCRLVGTTELFRIAHIPANNDKPNKPGKYIRDKKQNDWKKQITGDKITGQINPPISVIRQTPPRLARFTCPFCTGGFGDSAGVRDHLKICALYLSGDN